MELLTLWVDWVAPTQCRSLKENLVGHTVTPACPGVRKSLKRLDSPVKAGNDDFEVFSCRSNNGMGTQWAKRFRVVSL